MKHLFLALCLLLCCAQLPAQETDSTLHIQEEPAHPLYSDGIIRFHSDIRLDTTGEALITEHIKVFTAGTYIKRGIFRNIPLYRKNKYGNKKRVDIHVIEVLKDGAPEPYNESEKDGDLVIRIGSADVELETGVYEYAITYSTTGHVGFFDSFDEFYWNVTGAGWQFPIVQASATVMLPYGAKMVQAACYTGEDGSTASNCTISYSPEGAPTFSTTQMLEPGNGFTIAPAFTAGIVMRPPPPGFGDRLRELYENFRSIALALFGGLGLFLYFYFSWKKHGVDPGQPVTVPAFQPPDGLSPAALRYLYKRSTDSKGNTAALVSLAVKKAIRIKETSRKEYTIEKLESAPKNLPKEEQQLFSGLLSSRESIKLDNKQYRIFESAGNAFNTSLKEQYRIRDYFLPNTKQILIGGVLTGVTLFLYMLLTKAGSFFILLFLTPFLGVGVGMLMAGYKHRHEGCSAAVYLVFGLPFTIVPLVFVFLVMEEIPFAALAFMIAAVVGYVVYIRLIKAPTPLGANMAAKIDGFRMYLETAEEHRLDMLTPPERTPQLFEKLLPYAIALDLENEWAEKFNTVLEQANYDPAWYDGERMNYTRFSSSFSNGFTSSFMTARIDPTPPRSSSGSSSSGSSSWSSGSSSGGSSGGGGGGGGGGGW
ncbi:DUF2207 domain-containing protein [Chitinophaga sp. GCM10012297]|uniref:DUF2207 domain-containing protein n=1 Tax=Chitinophaga chungangae TaxID=2821488 RepID=A0ABS3YBF6_9BACT|nr:DUF2207 domain-containing protein [Chitinophaga chungangae]MBO9151810.1 DUF2207 domain-containing protein [Chitinophaga chungangae]